MYVKTPGSKHPLAIEYDTGESILQGVDLDDGEGYISADGALYWERVETTQKSNLCLKVYANEADTGEWKTGEKR